MACAYSCFEVENLREVNPVPPWIIDSSLIILSSVLAFIAALYFANRKERIARANVLAVENDKWKARVIELENKIALVNAAVVPISTAFQAILIKELTHFHTPEMDALLVKIGPPNILNESEEKRLSIMLVERSKDLNGSISDSERDAATILPIVMKRAKAEQEILKTTESLNLISVATVLEIPGIKGDKP